MQAQSRELAVHLCDQGREGRLFAESVAAEVFGRGGDFLMRADVVAKPQQRGMDGLDIVDGAGTEENFW